MANALKAKGIPFALHVFAKGHHGLSLADEPWAAREYGEPYTFEQFYQTVKAAENGLLDVSDEEKALLSESHIQESAGILTEDTPSQEIMVWPDLADTWFRTAVL